MLSPIRAVASARASKGDLGFKLPPVPNPTGPRGPKSVVERANPLEGGAVVLCEHVRGGGDGDELPEDVLGHLHVVLCNHQCFLDVLVGVALIHQQLDLRADLRVGLPSPSRRSAAAGGRGDGRDRAVAAFRVDPPGQGLRGPLWGFDHLHESCRETVGGI